jgi:dTDP-glucose 4,6-dehydratase
MRTFNKILVTGGCGAIGSEVLNRLKLKYPNTTFLNLDALTYAGKEEHIEPPYNNYKFVYGNICDDKLISYVLNSEKPDGVIHFAAETHVDNSFGNSFQFTKTNIFGTHVLLECVRQYILQGNHFHMFLHMSTDEVYGSVDDNEPACSENSLHQPSNPYSATKAGAEMLCHAYQKSFHLPIIIVRCNNAISKYQNDEKLIPQAILRIKNGEKVKIHGAGNSKRTFVHAYDIADAMDVIMHFGINGKIYNIGTDAEFTVLETVETILSIMRPGEALSDWVEHVDDRAFQDYRYYIDATALKQLGWQDQISFRNAITSVVEHKQAKHSLAHQASAEAS